LGQCVGLKSSPPKLDDSYTCLVFYPFAQILTASAWA